MYYGWVIAVVGTLGFVASSPGQTYVISIFLDPLIKEFELTRTSFSTLYMMATLSGSLMLPKLGAAIDRYGCRTVLSLVSLGFAAALALASQIHGIWSLALALVSLRFLGQGSLCLASSTMINQWWVNKRGQVMGVVGLLAAVLGSGCFPPLVHESISRFGWRGTFLVEAAFIALVMWPAAQVLARHRPEQHGLSPDGAAATVTEVESDVEGMSLAEAKATSLFWLAAAGVSLVAMLVTGLHFHAVRLFEDHGLSAATAAATYLPMALTAAIVTLVSGWWADRIPAQKLLSLALVMMTLSMLAATQLASAVPVLLYAILLGATGGLFRTAQGIIWSQLFGRKALGAITGTASTLMVAGSAFGPLPLGWASDHWGSFDSMLVGLAFFPALLAVLTYRAKRCSVNRVYSS